MKHLRLLLVLAFSFLVMGCVTRTVIVKEYVPLQMNKALFEPHQPTPIPVKELKWDPMLSREHNLENQVSVLKKQVMHLNGDVSLLNGRLMDLYTLNTKLAAKADELNKERMKK